MSLAFLTRARNSTCFSKMICTWSPCVHELGRSPVSKISPISYKEPSQLMHECRMKTPPDCVLNAVLRLENQVNHHLYFTTIFKTHPKKDSFQKTGFSMTRSKQTRFCIVQKKTWFCMARSKTTWASWTIKFQVPISYMHFGVVSTTACPLNGLSLIVQHPLPLHPNIPSIWACICRQHHPALRCQAGRTVSGWYMYADIYIYMDLTWFLNQHSIIPGSNKNPGSEIDMIILTKF